MRKKSFVVSAFLIFLAGCGGKIPLTHFYSLENVPPPPTSHRALPLDVAVARFRAPQQLTQDRLVYRPAPYQLEFYNYHRWSNSPPDMLTETLVYSLKRSGLFRSVSSLQGGPRVDYLLRGYIHNLEEVNSAEGVTAQVALSVEVVDMKTHAVVWTGRGSSERQVADRSVPGVVQGLNDGVRQSLEQITQGLAAFFEKLPAAN